MTSTKKRDTMVAYGNLTGGSGDGGSNQRVGAQILTGARTYIIPFIATARDLTTFSGSKHVVSDQAARTATTCYMRGLKEKVQIQTSSGLPWQWRRICFTYRGATLIGTPQANYNWYAETSNGWMRTVNDFNTSTAAVGVLIGTLFRGQQSTDWSSYFTAPLDPTRVNVKYDKTRIIQSGNANGVMRNYNMWHPMNSNLVYDDDETGDSEASRAFSTDGKAGMGDYYVIDIIAGGTGSSTSDLLSFEPTASLYWHEK